MKQRCPSCLQYLPASSFSGVFPCACDVCAVAAKFAAVPASGTATAESGSPLPCLNSNNSTGKGEPVDFPIWNALLRVLKLIILRCLTALDTRPFLLLIRMAMCWLCLVSPRLISCMMILKKVV